MKGRKIKILSFSLLCAFLLAACTKSEKTQPRVLLPIETQLLGTWYVKKQVDTQQYYNINGILLTDTTKTYIKTYTAFTSSNYIVFKSDAFNAAGTGLGNLSLQVIDHAYGLASANGCASISGIMDSTYWYYDDTRLQILINQTPYDVISVTDTSLTLRYTTPYIAGTVKFDYNWCYLKK